MTEMTAGRGAWVAAAAFVLALGLVVDRPAAHAAAATASPRLVITPARLSFSTAGEVHALTFTNAGGAVLHTGNMSLVTAGARASDFVLDAPGPRELAPGASVVVNVTFHPIAGTAPAQAFAALLIPADDPTLPLDINLRTGAPADRRVAGVELTAGDSSLLGWIIFLPLFGAGLLQVVPASRRRAARAVALLAAGLPLALAALAVARFDPAFSVADGNNGLQLVAHSPLVRALGIEYFVGVDGLSVLLVLLAPLVGLAAVVASPARADDSAGRATLAARLLAQTGVTGVFVALDGVLLGCFWLLALVATAALAARVPPDGRRAGARAMGAALVSTALLSLALVALRGHAGVTYLCDGTPAAHTFDLLRLARANDFAAKAVPGLFGLSFTAIVWGALFAACVLALAPVAFAGLVSAMSLYGLMRLNVSLLPETTLAASSFLGTFGVLAALRAALLATTAKELDGLLARAGGVRLAIGLVGLAQLTSAGLAGALVLLVGHGLVTALALTVDRAPALDELPSDASPRRPRWIAFTLLASLGVPGLATFAGVALVVLDASTRHPLVALGVLAAFAISTGAHVRVLRRVLARSAEPATIGDVGRALGRLDLAMMAPVVALLLALGLAPAPILNTVATGVRDLLQLVARAHG